MLIKKVRLILINLSLLILFFPAGLLASVGYPVINNISSDILGSPPQVWGMVQDNHGVFFMAAGSGIVKYDGREWNLYKTSLKNSVRSIAINEAQTIYVGGTHEFGYLSPDSFDRYKYHGLSDSLKNIDFGPVLKTFVIGHSVYFIADHKRVFIFKNSSIKEIDTDGFSFFRAFKINDAVYLFSDNRGVAKISDDHFEILDNKRNPGSVYFAIPYDKESLLIGTLKEGLYLYSVTRKQWEKFENSYENELKLGNAYHAITLNNGNIAIATLKLGIFIIDPNGKPVLHVDKHSGLAINSTFYLYEDHYHDLWIGHEKGLSQIQLSLPYTQLNSISGIDGSLQNIENYNNYIFCGTSSGIFAKPLCDDEKLESENFINIDPDYIYNLDFKKIRLPGYKGDLLLASTLRNILWITPDNHVKELFNIYACYSIVQSQKIPGRIYLGNQTGVEVIDLIYSKNNIHVTNVTRLPEIKESIRKMVITDNGDLWLRTQFNNIYRIEFDDSESPNNFKLFNYNQLNKKFKDLSVTNLQSLDNKIVITTNYGIFSTPVEPDTIPAKAFIHDNSFGVNFNDDKQLIQDLTKDELGNYWLATQKGLISFNPVSGKIDDSRYKHLTQNKIHLIKSIKGLGLSVLSENEVYFIANSNQPMSDFNFEVTINLAEIGNNYLTIYNDGTKTDTYVLKKEIPENENSVSFEFCAPFYHQGKSIEYTSKLKAFDKEWSDYSTHNSRTYTNLPSGHYEFIVKARNIYGIESSESKFDFSVATPWYFRNIFIITYILVIGLIIWLSIYLYLRKIKKEKRELEKRIKAAISKEEQQKIQIGIQAQKLQEANAELEKLSLVASKTDNAIVIMDPQGEIEWINEGYERLYGYSYHDLLISETGIIGDNTNTSIREMVNSWFGKRQPIIFENQKKTKSGKTVWAQTTLTPVLNDNDEIIHLIAIDTDITQLKIAESEIHTQRDKIKAQRDMALIQRDAIVQQKREIIDSIQYAKRIQSAVFNNEEDLQGLFSESFLLNKPRDIVTGDFIWVYQFDQFKIVAVIDCTGHGVPGAFMSLIGISFLNTIVKENGVINSSDILNLLRDKVIASLDQTGKEGETNDGMDVSLMIIDTRKKELTFSGANCHAYLVRDKKLMVLSADKMPISISHLHTKPFSEHKINYLPDDFVYMFTDGFADQFGGKFGKKLKIKPFKELLLAISTFAFDQQKNELRNAFLSWKGKLDQVDDVLVAGFKIES